MSNYKSLHAGPLTAIDLVDLRAEQDVYLPDVCNIVRGTATRSGQGSPQEASGTVASNVPCRVSLRWWERSEEQIQLGGRETSLQSYIVTLPYATDIKEQDQVEVGTLTYEVERVIEDSPTWRTCRRVDVFLLSD